jgi:hypothetical protein
MPDFAIPIDIYFLAALMSLAMLAGFLLRGRQLTKKKRKIAELEHEVLEANAEVLEMQKDYCEMESRVATENSPVISIKKPSESGAGRIENY